MISAQDLPVAFFGVAVFLLLIVIAIRDAERKLSEVSRSLDEYHLEELQASRDRVRALEAREATAAAFDERVMGSIHIVEDSGGETAFGPPFGFGKRE